MHKFLSLACMLLFFAILAGCGSKTSPVAAVVTTLPARIALTATDVSGKTFYSTSLTGYVAYEINADGSAAWDSVENNAATPVLGITGTWSISPTGSLVLTDTTTSAIPTVTHQFTVIQKESSYWLVYDESNSNRISRFYFGALPAQAYLASIQIAPARARLGGSVQGTPLASVFNNVTTAAGFTGTPGFANTSTATVATFDQPTGITTDGANLYVADTNNHTIRKIVIASGVVTRLAGIPGVPGIANSTDGTGNKATFNSPTGITTDGTFLYVADTGNNAIRKVDMATGEVTLIAGSSTGVAEFSDALVGTDARFNQPAGITTDGTNLYVTDSGNHTIRKIVLSTNHAVVTLAGVGKTAGFTDGTGTAAFFNLPVRITTDGSNLYVTDTNNRTVRKVVISTGAVSTIAGIVGVAGFADTTPTVTATFNQPNGITTDGTNLFVTDSFNNTIRKLTPPAVGVTQWTVSTIAGTVGVLGASDGDGTSPLTATFNRPIGITTDGISLYVADVKNHKIRKIN